MVLAETGSYLIGVLALACSICGVGGVSRCLSDGARAPVRQLATKLWASTAVVATLPCAAAGSPNLDSGAEPQLQCWVGEYAQRECACCAAGEGGSFSTPSGGVFSCWGGGYCAAACCGPDPTGAQRCEGEASSQRVLTWWTTADYWEIRYRYHANGIDDERSAASRLGRRCRTEKLAEVFFDASRQRGGAGLSVLELGCGAGYAAGTLIRAVRPVKEYVGVDISRAAAERARDHIREQFGPASAEPLAEGREVTFHDYDGFSLPAAVAQRTFDVVISLSVMMHLLEGELFSAYMRHLFLLSHQYVIIQGDNVDAPRVNHMRGWRFTDWIRREAVDWGLLVFWRDGPGRG